MVPRDSVPDTRPGPCRLCGYFAWAPPAALPAPASSSRAVPAPPQPGCARVSGEILGHLGLPTNGRRRFRAPASNALKGCFIQSVEFRVRGRAPPSGRRETLIGCQSREEGLGWRARGSHPTSLWGVDVRIPPAAAAQAIPGRPSPLGCPARLRHRSGAPRRRESAEANTGDWPGSSGVRTASSPAHESRGPGGGTATTCPAAAACDRAAHFHARTDAREPTRNRTRAGARAGRRACGAGRRIRGRRRSGRERSSFEAHRRRR